MLELVGVIVLICAVFCAGVWDWRYRRIPNALTLMMVVSGLLLGALDRSMDTRLLGMLIGAIPALLMYARGTMGGGDVKLLAGIGALVGYPMIVDVLLYSIVFGALLSGMYLLVAGELTRYLTATKNLVLAMLIPGAPKIVPCIQVGYPFGVAAALASGLTVLLPSMRITGRLGGFFG